MDEVAATRERGLHAAVGTVVATDAGVRDGFGQATLGRSPSRGRPCDRWPILVLQPVSVWGQGTYDYPRKRRAQRTSGPRPNAPFD